MPLPAERYYNRPERYYSGRSAPNPLREATGRLNLQDITKTGFLPEYEEARRRRGVLEGAFFGQANTPGALYGAASEAARGTAAQLFAPGGEIQKAIGGIRGQAIGAGFNPADAIGGEDAILREGTKRVADTFATQAAGLEGQRFGALAQAYGLSLQGASGALENVYTGIAGAHQLTLARKRPKFLGLF